MKHGTTDMHTGTDEDWMYECQDTSNEGMMTKRPDLEDKDGPDDFLKYFISITAERKRATRAGTV